MAPGGLEESLANLVVVDAAVGISNGDDGATTSSNEENGGVQVTSFTEVLDDVTLHFQIIRLQKQIYAWIGCNSAKFGHLYAAAPTRPLHEIFILVIIVLLVDGYAQNNAVSVTNILGGGSDNAGSGIARRIVLKTGLNVILACNIPKNSPMLEADAEKMLVQKLINLGYAMPKSNGSSS
ncbi:hypothetical protein RHSIM_Rhsim04G0247300 [Rhododendron simsii]|uniref:Proteasome assembly chaperone 4 n=1 Tax=Rhododendron simsii TaxID=118357 RepID=A0A834LQP4_RHOSS|nr:hypothetical protein RHSIM_Rhsim04G0247300 [Rhododendron simsii]